MIRLLQFSAQAAHDMVPPDSIEPVLKAVINNFVTERNSAEVMAVGLNAVRELCARWRMEDGGWRMEDGRWRMEDGGCVG